MIAQSILSTLKYFDLQEHPLTFLELSRLLFKVQKEDARFSADRLLECLGKLEDQRQIQSLNGFYFLPGRGNLVERRLSLYPIYLHRVRRAFLIVRLLRFVPFVRGVALSGSLAAMNSTTNSDIDFFIITKRERIWLARVGLSLLTQVLGVRRHHGHVANRICLNHYVVENKVLESDHTLYSAVEYSSLLVLLNPKVFSNLLAHQTWLKDFLLSPPPEASQAIFMSKISVIAQPFFERVIDILGGDLWEVLARYFQKKRIAAGPTVLVSDEELSFHPGSKGQAFLAKFKEQVNP